MSVCMIVTDVVLGCMLPGVLSFIVLLLLFCFRSVNLFTFMVNKHTSNVVDAGGEL